MIRRIVCGWRCSGWFAALLLAVSALNGCGGGVGKSQYDRLRIGMRHRDAENILGGPGTKIPFEEMVQLVESKVEIPELPPVQAGDADVENPAPKMTPEALRKSLMPNLTGCEGYRWGNDKKYILVVFSGGIIQRYIKEGF